MSADLTFNLLGQARSAIRAVRETRKEFEDLDSTLDKLSKTSKILAAVAPAGGPVLGLMLALPGAAAGGAAAMAAVKLATRGMGEAMTAVAEGDAEKLEEALGKLSPSARTVVQEFAAVRGEWNKLGAATQEAMFAELVGDLSQLTQTYVPALRKSLPGLAGEIGQVGSGLVDWATSADSVEQVNTIVEGSADQVRNYGVAIESILDAFLTLGAEGMPVATRLTGAVANLAGGFRDWVDEAERSGQLDEMLAGTETTISLLEDSVGSLGAAVGNVFANPAAIEAGNRFLGVLASGLNTVEGLTSAFAQLPDGVQSFVLTAGLAALAGTKLWAVQQRLAASTAAVAVNMEKGGRAGTAMGRGMTAITAGGGRAIAVIGGMQIASAALADSNQSSGVSTDRLAESLVRFGDTGDVAGDMVDVLGGRMGRLNNDLVVLEKDGFAGFGTGLATVIENVTGTGALFDDSVQNSKRRLAELDTALAQLVQSGNVEGAKDAFERISDAARDQGVNIDELRKGMPQYSAAVKDAAAATGPAGEASARTAQSSKLMAMSFADAAREAGGLKSMLDLLNGAAIGSAQAQINYEAALDNVTQSIKDNGATLDVNTEKGRAVKQAMIEGIVLAGDYAAAREKEGATAEEVNAIYSTSIARLQAQATAAGLSAGEMAGLTAQFGRTAGGAQFAATTVAGLDAKIDGLQSKIVDAKARGAGESSAEVKGLRDEIARLRDKRVEITTIFLRRIIEQHQETFNITKRWGGIDYHAAGGAMIPAHFATSPTVLYGERETGGEAFIPKNGDVSRNRSIAQTVVEDWLGGRIMWPDAGRAAAARAPRGNQAAPPRSTADDDRIVRLFGTALAGMSIVLDGQTVGRLQGRQADLYTRGG